MTRYWIFVLNNEPTLFLFVLSDVFLDPENPGIDNKIIKFELIVIDLWPFGGFGGRLGRHLEKILFRWSNFGKFLVYKKYTETYQNQLKNLL